MSWQRLRHLVLVAGHAIPYRFDRLACDDGWFLKPFQSGEGCFYTDHVRTGVSEAAADPQALLVFSGGQSDPLAGPRSEAQGYWQVADAHHWYGFADLACRATTEEFALDSFLNLLYGVCRFREATGAYPERIVVVGWAFKAARFDFHRQTLAYPAGRYRYIGANDPPGVDEARLMEAARLTDFRADPYGSSPALAATRAARNPFCRQHGYAASCPEIAGLLAHRGPEPYPGLLPWL